MRSTETYYSTKRLHVVFAISSLALLAVTVWMVAADHLRPWKGYQRTFRDEVEPWLTESRIWEEQTDQWTARQQELEDALAELRAAVPKRALVEQFCKGLRQDASRRGVDLPDLGGIEAAYEAMVAEPSTAAHDELIARLSECLTAAVSRQENVGRRLRFRRADFLEARSLYEAGVGEGLSQAELERLQGRVDRIGQEVEELVAGSQAASAHCDALGSILGQITHEEDALRQALAEHRAAVARLNRALAEQRSNLGKRVLRLPFVDALGRPLAVDQIWLPELTTDYNFRQVARFDRCMTCHLGMDKTVPGSPSEPGCLRQQTLTVLLPIPEEVSDPDGGDNGGTGANEDDGAESRLRKTYGLALAPRGILQPDAATVGLVLPRTPAADAKLLPGDVIRKIDGVQITGRDEAGRRLLEAAQHDEASEEEDEDEGLGALELEIRRGLPHPYSSHPRLDLFVGSLSPHPKSTFGCTICHEGQGSATEFKFASHTPNDPHQRARWRKNHGWFFNEHWDFPMRPARFVQSGCLKCHHDVTDLAPSDRFPQTAAPKLLAGYHLVRQNGCFGCHEIRGVTAAGERIGPDVRLEPNYHEAALELLARPDLGDEARLLARRIVRSPDYPEARRQLAALLTADRGEEDAPASGALRAASAAAVKVLAAEDPAPGTMRKVGPSMRHMAGKLDAPFLDDWLREPTAFRPDTRMPQFYRLHEHLDGKGLRDARRFEAVEIRAVTDYVLAVSQPAEPVQTPPGVTEPPSAQRGKRLFLTQGCLACHTHEDYPQGQSTFGADLTGLAAKLSTEAGRTWLVGWIRDPARHAPRTLMPNMLLEPAPLTLTAEGEDGDAAENGKAESEESQVPQGATGGAQGATGGLPARVGPPLPSQADKQPSKRPPRMTDPAADIAAYLLDSTEDGEKPKRRQPLVEADLDELVLLHLSKTLSTKRAKQYLNGTLELTAEQARGDAVELLGRVTRQKKVRYVGRSTIRKRGCFGCHDIPAFEDAQPIGPALSDWGRKRESLLAFEQIHRLLAEKPDGSGDSSADGKDGSRDADPSGGFFIEALLAHRREGFIWQKLRAPRSFDYKKTENKGYNERLTMGRFSLSPEEREAIITFVLGLVAEPPAAKYVYQADRRRKAIVEGGKVLDQFGCAECHTLQMARWQVEYDPDQIEEPFEIDDFPFMRPRIDARKLEASAKPDRRGLLRAEAVGMPERDEFGELVEDIDDDDNPLYFLNLWEPLPTKVGQDWAVWPVGGAQIGISDPFEIAIRLPHQDGTSGEVPHRPGVRPTYTPHLTAVRPAVGGAFARLLFPHALSDDNPAVTEGWGWVPPPLAAEGSKVQPAWLHDYLLEPFAIRPSVVLRMPKYTMSPAEAGKLVDYFAATAGVEFPYSSDPRSRSAGLEAKEAARPKRLDDALRIVIDRTTFCTKCHLVGDFSPGGEIQTVLAPRLDLVSRRLRPEYLRRWVANPKSQLPYTGMPVNFPPTGPPLGQDLFKGPSIEQLDAVTDLLLNWDWYMRHRTSIRAMMQSGTTPDGR